MQKGIQKDLPVFYSYRRCPYAMRARMALFLAGVNVEVREISFHRKPAPMLAASPKGTVPVLVLEDGTVIDESLDILHWALQPNLSEYEAALIAENDTAFKRILNAYKYPDRAPEKTQSEWRNAAFPFLAKLEEILKGAKSLSGPEFGAVDIALMPFIRQFSKVDEEWWETAPFPFVQRWLKTMQTEKFFTAVMEKYAEWIPEHAPQHLIIN